MESGLQGSGVAESGREAILYAAAECFMRSGFNATSIDDVAASLGATKGRVYHYYRSKADLFFDVHRRGMEINLSTIGPIAAGNAPPRKKLEAMCSAHLRVMLDYIRFQRVVMQGVEMHLAGATTPAQRRELGRLMDERERYEGLFRKVLLDGRETGVFSFSTPSFASKALLAVLNNPVLWYRPREGEDAADREAIIEEFTRFALNSVSNG